MVKQKAKKKLIKKVYYMANLKNLAIHKLFIFNIILVLFVLGLVLIFTAYFPPAVIDPDILLPKFINDISPKPVEKLVFMLSIIVVGLFSLIYVLLDKQQYLTTKINKYLSHILPIIICVVLYSCLINSDFIELIFRGFHEDLENATEFWLLVFFIIALILNVLIWKTNKSLYRPLALLLNWLLFLLALAIHTFSWRILNVNSLINYSNRFITHFDASLYALSQVVNGKTILVDTNSQYGLFPELIAPIFKLINLTVLNFSLLMAFLETIALISIFYIVTKLIRSQFLIFIGGCTLLLITSEDLCHVTGNSEFYYQYWPIRFIFPAISVSLIYWFSTKKTISKSVLISFVSAISVIWNMDTGIFIFISYVCYLLVLYIFNIFKNKNSKKENLQWQNRHYIISLILHFMILMVTLLVFFMSLQLSSGQPLNYKSIFEYQMIFYKLGFYMLPIPLSMHPWMIVISIYIYGLIVALYALRGKTCYKSDLILYLSILGIGLFIYYEGRSHVLNLFKVMWPAIILGLIFADNIIRSVKLKLIYQSNLIISALILSIFIICSGSLIINIPSSYMELIYRFDHRNVFASPEIEGELDLIRRHTHKGQECLLLVKNQASFYAEIGLASPIKGPGLVETLLKSDVKTIEDQIRSIRPQCVFLGVGSLGVDIGLNYNNLFFDYNIVDENNEKNLLFLQPK